MKADKNCYLLMNVEGVMGAWPSSPRTLEGFATEKRGSEITPTASAIYGMIGAVLGILDFEEDRKDALTKAVKIGKMENVSPYKSYRYDDYCTAHREDGFDTVDGKKKDMVPPTIKEYVTNVHWHIRLYGEREILEKIAYRFDHPVFQPYIGRSNCLFSGRINGGFFEE